MDEECGQNQQFNISLNRFSQTQKKRASAMSLERSNHNFNRQSSINNRHSFLQIMSLEGSQKYQNFYQKQLFEEKRRSIVRNSNKDQSNNYNNQENQQQPIKTQRSSSNNKIIRHQCKCMTYCLQNFCICFYQNQQICLQGHCCDNCIKFKLQKLKNQSKLQGCFCLNSHCKNLYCKCFKAGKKCDPRTCSCNECRNTLECYDIKQHQHIQKYIKYSQRVRRLIDEKGYGKIQQLVCSCRKSNCLKQYCCCYYHGVGCGPRCKCKNCRNLFQQDDDIQEIIQQRQRFGRIESQSQKDESQKQNFDNQQLPESMQFDHPSIRKH